MNRLLVNQHSDGYLEERFMQIIRVIFLSILGVIRFVGCIISFGIASVSSRLNSWSSRTS